MTVFEVHLLDLFVRWSWLFHFVESLICIFMSCGSLAHRNPRMVSAAGLNIETEVLVCTSDEWLGSLSIFVPLCLLSHRLDHPS